MKFLETEISAIDDTLMEGIVNDMLDPRFVSKRKAALYG